MATAKKPVTKPTAGAKAQGASSTVSKNSGSPNRRAREKGVKPRPAHNKGPRGPNREILADPGDPKYTQLTPLVLEAFLAAFSLSGNITQVCSELRVNRSTLLAYKREHPEFGAAYIKAQEDAFEGWEAEVARRAFQGTKKEVYQQGELVGYTTEFSDRLAEMMIRAGKPAKYTPKTVSTVEHAGSVGIKYSELSLEDLNREIARNAATLGILAMSSENYRKLMGRDAEDDGTDPVKGAD